MRIEVIDFYPFKKQDPGTLKGTLHVYIIDLDKHLRGINMDLRGIGVFVKGSKYKFFFPNYEGYDFTEEQKIRYPVINFTDLERSKALKKAIFTQGKAFIQKKLREK